MVSVDHARGYICPAEPQQFDTANGPYTSGEAVSLSFRIGNMRYDAKPYLMENTPSVLSMGMRCMHEEFSFVWMKGRDPCIITPLDDIEPLSVYNCVLYHEPSKSESRRGDHLNDYSNRCAVSIKNGRVLIT